MKAGKQLFFFLLLILNSCWLPAQDRPRWLRYCSISPDGSTIAFSYKGHLFRVPAKGGEAVALTGAGTTRGRSGSGEGGGKVFYSEAADLYDFMPVWSHDGRSIAYASDRYGNFDIFIIPATGGEPRRLTAHSSDEFPYDFADHDSTVLFGAVRMDAASNRQFPSEALQELYKVPVAGGRVLQVLTTPAEDARVSPDGRYIIYHDRKGRENPWRKHQTSSIARDIWLYDTYSGHHTRVTSFRGEDRSPVFAGTDTAIYYLSEEGGTFNIRELALQQPGGLEKSILPDTGNNRPITAFKRHPVRFLSISRGQTLCFGYDGEIYIKKKNAAPVRVAIKIPETSGGGMTEDAKSGINANEKKGKIAGKAGEEKIISVEGTKRKKTIPIEETEKTIPIGEAKEMAVSPDGEKLAFIFRGDVFISDLQSKTVQQITHTPGEEAGIRFSPDGYHLLYAAERDSSWKICEMDLNDRKEILLIADGQENYQPKYSPDGKEIAYIGNRTSLKIYSIGSRRSRIILDSAQLYSRRDQDQTFEWSPDGKWLLVQYDEQGAGNEEVGLVCADGKSPLVNLTQSGFSDTRPKWMMDGKMLFWLSDRNGLHSYANSSTRQQDVYAMPVGEKDRDPEKMDRSGRKQERLSTQSSLLADALVSRNGDTLYYLAGSDRGYDLWRTDLHTKQTKLLLPLHADDPVMEWDGAQKNIFLLSDGRICRIDPVTTRMDSVNTRGRMILDPAAERNSMFEHVWRRTKETFYTPGLHGTDWDACKTAYSRYLPFIGNNYDFAEMLNELLGELNVSHTGATYRPSRKDKDITASLGAYYNQSYRDTGIQIGEVIADGPLDNPAFGIRPGTVITAIDGVPLTADRDLAFFLNRKAGKEVRLTLRAASRLEEAGGNDSIGEAGNRGSVKEITVKLISPDEENELIYKRWVRRNEEETDSLSHGELGYVHLYRMNDAAYRNTYETVLGKYARRKGIVVDTRFNRGGDLAPELTVFLSGSRIRDNAAGSFLINSEPSFRWTKASIVLANEANYSDGSCFVYDYQLLHMGKLVGMPVPGSCTFMTGQSLPDPTLTWSAPTVGVKDTNGRYLENHQTEPDIRVMNEYGAVGAGRDQQLEEAVRQLLKEVGTGGGK